MFISRRSTSPGKSGNNRDLRVFISYSHANLEIAKRIAAALEDNGIDVLIDLEDIGGAVEWKPELADMIRRSDKVVWLVSKPSIDSPWCKMEIDLQKDLEKALVPIKVGEIPDEDVPEDLAKLQMQSFLPPVDFDTEIKRLVQTLLVSQVWVKQQTWLEDQAASPAWQRSDRCRDLAAQATRQRMAARKPEIRAEADGARQELHCQQPEACRSR